MDEIFENILYFIPVALIIAVRIFNARQKQARKQQQKSAPPPPPVIVQKPKASDEARPHWEVPDWPDTKKKQPVQPRPAIRLEAEDDPKQLIKRILSGSVPSSQPAKPAKVKKPAQSPLPKQGAPLFPEPERSPAANAGPAAKTKSPVSAAPETGPGLFAADLSPLQRAMVWSEILGPPRSETM